MKVWVVLLRGVNVGGHKKLPMAEFRTALGSLGYQDVATYIQSGNAVFRAEGSVAQIAKQIGEIINRTFGFDADVMVLSRETLVQAVADNPFGQAEDNPTTLHLFFAGQAIGSFDSEAMKLAATDGEAFHVAGRVLYFYTPNGMGRSKLAGSLGRFIKTPITGRNLRSCHKITALAGAL